VRSEKLMPAADKSRPRPAKRAPRKTKPAARSLVDALGEAAWSEADRALGEAIVEAQILSGAKNAEARDVALALLEQALSRAARKRGLTRIGEPGAREAYNAKRHELARPMARAPKQVRIVASGIGRAGTILVKARVVAVRSRS
jgi:hypothetical protein